jgi:ABC-type dipeptide/oligopeptide/nickel transport system permease component
MGLRGYIAKRLIYTLFLVFFVITINFIIFEVMPFSPVDFFTGSRQILSPEKVAAILHRWGMDQPWHIRYLTYLTRMLTWDFGETSPATGSMSVATRIMDYLPNTLILEGISTVFSILIGVVMGVVAAHKRGGLFDSASVITSLIAFSLPTFWLGLLLIAAFHGILPSGRIVDDNMPAWSFIWLFGTKISFPTMVELQSRIMHLILPVTVLTLIQYGNYLLLTRATMLETLTEDYILTAKAKGLKERTIIFKHALKNASLPIITSSALAFGFLISGAMITETVFSYPGIGFLTINSINVTHDYPVLHAIFYVTALTVIIANFISDLLYGVIDPRIKYG